MTQVTVYSVRLLIEVPDVEAFSDWFYDRYEGVVAEHAGQAVLEAEIETSGSGTEAAKALVRGLTAHPRLQVLGVDLDLVNASDIAERAAVTRQYVAQLVSGSTGPGSFPRPLGVPGRTRVWDWGSVNEWLRQLGKADDETYLTYRDACRVEAWLHQRVEDAAVDAAVQAVTAGGLGVTMRSNVVTSMLGTFAVDDLLIGISGHALSPDHVLRGGWVKRVSKGRMVKVRSESLSRLSKR